MKDKTLPDKEIVKALEECIELKFDDTEYATVRLDTLTNALDLITCQQAESENLKVENQSLRSAANSLKIHYEEAQAKLERLRQNLNIELEKFATEYDDKIKAEAYKEFAERLKTEYAKGMNWFKKKESYYVDVDNIDNLLKEMVGESND